MNLDILNTNNNTQMYKDLLESYNYRIINTVSSEFATRCTNFSSTLIDHIITDLPQFHFTSTVKVIESSLSDHKALYCEYLLRSYPKSQMMMKEFKKVNNSIFNEYVKLYVNSVENPTLVELIEIIKQAKEIATTIIKKRVRIESFKWISLEILELIKKRDSLYKKLNKATNKQNLQTLFEEVSKHLKEKITAAKKENFFKKIANSDNSKKLWDAINEEIGTKKNNNRELITEIINESGKVFDSTSEIANNLNEHFVKFTKTLRTRSNANRLKNPANQKTFFLHPITEREVINEILMLKVNSSPGIDGITSQDLKLLSDIIVPILTREFNNCLENGVFPECLKQTDLIPIYKEGDPRKCNNYRPISLLPSIGKLFEKILNKRLTTFINDTIKIDENQFRFQQNSGTDAALSRVLKSLNQYLDVGQYVLILFIDLRKAFDLVEHQTLIDILEDLGIRGVASNLFKSYLSGRKVATRIGKERSSTLLLEDGVPQGSVLGPTLYLLYINSLRHLQINGERTIYADDTCFLYHGHNKQIIEEQVKTDLHRYIGWLDGTNW